MKIKNITSTQNDLIKKVKYVYENQHFAKKHNLFVIEKAKLIFEAINKNVNIEFILITENEYKIYKNKLVKYLNEKKIIFINEKISKYLSINVTYSNIFALCKYLPNNNFVIQPNKNYLLLDSIQDPGNLGTILRTAFGLGIDNVFLYNCVYHFNNKCTKSCSGANFNNNIVVIDKLFDFIKLFNKKYDIICTSLDNDSDNINNVCFQKNNNLIILGNEGHGINKDLQKIANKKIKLTMHNNIESFNVAIFAAIICFKVLN